MKTTTTKFLTDRDLRPSCRGDGRIPASSGSLGKSLTRTHPKWPPLVIISNSCRQTQRSTTISPHPTNENPPSPRRSQDRRTSCNLVYLSINAANEKLKFFFWNDRRTDFPCPARSRKLRTCTTPQVLSRSPFVTRRSAPGCGRFVRRRVNNLFFFSCTLDCCGSLPSHVACGLLGQSAPAEARGGRRTWTAVPPVQVLKIAKRETTGGQGTQMTPNAHDFV